MSPVHQAELVSVRSRVWAWRELFAATEKITARCSPSARLDWLGAVFPFPVSEARLGAGSPSCNCPEVGTICCEVGRGGNGSLYPGGP